MTVLNRKGKELREAVKRALRDEGATDFVSGITGTELQCVDFTLMGKRGHFTFACTPSGIRSRQNAVGCAKRVARAIKSKALEQSETLEVVSKRWRAKPGSKLSHLRIEAHQALDARWQFGTMTRKQAYVWLARHMGLSLDDCHIGMFGEKECERVIEICRSKGNGAPLEL